MFSNILVALDGSETSSRALDAALMLASQMGARLNPVYAVILPEITSDVIGYDPSLLADELRDEGRRIVDEAAKRMADRGIAGTPRVAESEPLEVGAAQRLLSVAHDIGADMIVMGTHGRSGLTRLVLGSVAEHVLREATCAVMTVSARSVLPE